MLQRMKHMLSRKILIVVMMTYFLKIGLFNGYYWSDEQALLRHVQDIERREGTVAYEQLAMRFDDNEEKVLGLIHNASTFSKRSLWLKRLGNIYHKRGDYPKAIAALQEAVAVDPKNIEAINELAVCFLETLDTTQGIALLDHSLKVQPKQVDAWRIKGIALYRWGRFPEAIESLKQALIYDPQSKEPLLHLMMAYFFVNDEKMYLATVDRVTPRVCEERELLKFAGLELFGHDHFKECAAVFSQSAHLWSADPHAAGIWQECRRRSQSLPK
jgi:tetratricopeptide (TPR) repeat protein